MDNSPLCSLPPELRNYIYELALTQPSPIQVITISYPTESPLHLKADIPHARALSQTCKQLRQETHQLLYAYNAFVITLGTFKLSPNEVVNRMLRPNVLHPLIRFLAGLLLMDVASFGSLTVDFCDDWAQQPYEYYWTCRESFEQIEDVVEEVRDTVGGQLWVRIHFRVSRSTVLPAHFAFCSC